AVALGCLVLLAGRGSALVWVVGAGGGAVFVWIGPKQSMTRVLAGGALLAVREGPMVTASVVNDASGARYLEVNGHFRMGGTNSVRSDHRQAMLPLLLHPGPHRALFLGIGTGATVMGGAPMPGVSVHGVGLAPEVGEALPWFANPAAPGPLPPITVADARRYVTADTRQYDVIIADLFHPALDGSGALYTTEHFAAVGKRLAPGGLFCQWLPLYQLDLPSLRAIIRGFLDVYPNGSAWLNHYSVYTPMLALIGNQEGGGDLDVDTLAARLSDRAIGAVARPLGFDAPMDVLGQYVAGPRALAAFAGEGPRNTDNYPLVALDASRNVRALSAPPSTSLLALTRALQPDPSELLQGGRDTLADRMTAYWRARNRFLEAGASLKGDPRGLALIEAASPGLLEALRLSAEFEPAYGPLMAMARTLMASDRRAAAHLLHQIEHAAPSRREARELLSREFNE